MRRLANCWQLLFRDNHRAIVKRSGTASSLFSVALAAFSCGHFFCQLL
jgi:hypothetical protein